MNTATLTRVRQRVADTLTIYEPRIDVVQLVVTGDPSPPARLEIDLEYRVRATNARGNLVYPFYLQEGPS